MIKTLVQDYQRKRSSYTLPSKTQPLLHYFLDQVIVKYVQNLITSPKTAIYGAFGDFKLKLISLVLPGFSKLN